MRAVAVWFFRSFILLGFVVIAFEAATWIYPPVLPWGLALLGRGSGCSPSAVFVGAQQRAALAERSQQMADRHRVARQEGALDLIELGREQWWAPRGSGVQVAVIRAQQQGAIYGAESMKGQTVLDCGAHIGLYARQALDQGAAQVVAIEPSALNLESMKRNLAPEIDRGQVRVVPEGVWNTDTTLTFFTNPKHSAGDSFVIKSGDDTAVTNVPVSRIDTLVRRLELTQVHVIKMDIKGATAKALDGARETLTRFRPRLVISTEEQEDDPAAITALLARHGYSFRCGNCSVSAAWRVVPDVLIFEPR